MKQTLLLIVLGSIFLLAGCSSDPPPEWLPMSSATPERKVECISQQSKLDKSLKLDNLTIKGDLGKNFSLEVVGTVDIDYVFLVYVKKGPTSPSILDADNCRVLIGKPKETLFSTPVISGLNEEDNMSIVTETAEIIIRRIDNKTHEKQRDLFYVNDPKVGRKTLGMGTLCIRDKCRKFLGE